MLTKPPQRLYTLAGVTYNEWIGLGGNAEAVSMKWLLEHHAELGVEPADLSAMVCTLYTN